LPRFQRPGDKIIIRSTVDGYLGRFQIALAMIMGPRFVVIDRAGGRIGQGKTENADQLAAAPSEGICRFRDFAVRLGKQLNSLRKLS
jgi:hypothetical protein